MSGQWSWLPAGVLGRGGLPEDSRVRVGGHQAVVAAPAPCPSLAECSSFSPPTTVILLILLCFEGLLFLIFTSVMFGTQVHSICTDETVRERRHVGLGAQWTGTGRGCGIAPFAVTPGLPTHTRPRTELGSRKGPSSLGEGRLWPQVLPYCLGHPAGHRGTCSLLGRAWV